MTYRSMLRVALLAALFLGFSQPKGSCVQFDGQRVRVHVNDELDRLDLQIVYRDLHATGVDTAGALEQLETLRAGERWFAFMQNWPWMVHLEALLADPPEVGSPGAAVLAVLERGLQVRPSELWIDDGGRLCASQLVRLDGLDALVAAANDAFHASLADAKVRARFLDDLGITDRESRAHFDTALHEREPLLERRGAAFAVTLTLDDAGFLQLARHLLAQVTEADLKTWRTPQGDDPASRDFDHLLAVLAANDLAIERRRDRVSLVLGDPGAREWSFVTPPTGRSQPASLVAPLTEAGWTIHGVEYEKRVIDAFEAFISER